MTNTLAALLLSSQLLLFQPAAQQTALPAQARCILQSTRQQTGSIRLWWGMIDPEMATWFAHIPQAADRDEDRILWDWSWRGFFAALFGQTEAKEESPNAAMA